MRRKNLIATRAQTLQMGRPERGHLGEFESEVQEFAARIRGRLDAHKHKTIATLRKGRLATEH